MIDELRERSIVFELGVFVPAMALVGLAVNPCEKVVIYLNARRDVSELYRYQQR